VFDGKPPSEKSELLEKRKMEKKMAEEKYLLLKHEMENNANLEPDKKEDLLAELDHLKKKFVRIRESDIQKAKDLMQAYGIMYLESHGEADQLCAYLTRNQYAWACVSDDMDMFVFGCQRVLRHMSLLNHTAILYDTYQILNEINIPYCHFKDILVLSGTDYNIGEKTSLYETLKWYNQYMKYSVEKGQDMCFYDWLMKYSKYIHNREKLDKVHSMFDLSLYALHNHTEILNVIHSLPFRTHNMDVLKLQTLMMDDGFIFV
jgi:5'-3' exonuclease